MAVSSPCIGAIIIKICLNWGWSSSSDLQCDFFYYFLFLLYFKIKQGYSGFSSDRVNLSPFTIKQGSIYAMSSTVLCCKVFKNLFCFGFFEKVWDHIWQCLGAALNSVLRCYSHKCADYETPLIEPRPLACIAFSVGWALYGLQLLSLQLTFFIIVLWFLFFYFYFNMFNIPIFLKKIVSKRLAL